MSILVFPGLFPKPNRYDLCLENKNADSRKLTGPIVCATVQLIDRKTSSDSGNTSLSWSPFLVHHPLPTTDFWLKLSGWSERWSCKYLVCSFCVSRVNVSSLQRQNNSRKERFSSKTNLGWFFRILMDIRSYKTLTSPWFWSTTSFLGGVG